MPFAFTTPLRENGIAERPQTLRYPENKNNSSAEYAQSARGAHSKSSCPARAFLRSAQKSRQKTGTLAIDEPCRAAVK
jgi:hypothetical protein